MKRAQMQAVSRVLLDERMSVPGWLVVTVVVVVLAAAALLIIAGRREARRLDERGRRHSLMQELYREQWPTALRQVAEHQQPPADSRKTRPVGDELRSPAPPERDVPTPPRGTPLPPGYPNGQQHDH